MANKPIKRCSLSFTIRELKIKTVRYHYVAIRMTETKERTITNADKDAVEQELSTARENAKYYSHFGRQLSSLL